MRVGSGVILFQLAGFLTSALADFYFAKHIQQAVQANLSLTTIRSLPIPLLEDNDMAEFVSLISPVFMLMKANEEENCKLSRLRDTLLPQLMSGELDVSEIDL